MQRPTPESSMEGGDASFNTIVVTGHCPPAMRKRETWRVDQFHLMRKIGSGYASTVYVATCRLTGNQAAIKMYHKNKLSELNKFQVQREIRIHAGLDHKHIIQLWAAFEDQFGIYLVSEYASKGDVFSEVERRGGQMTEADAVRQVLHPFLSSLEYLHSYHIIHRDIKPENLLFMATGALKVGDFGLSINTTQERPVTRVGTLDYMAPEVVVCPDKHKPSDHKELTHLHYTSLVDSWAVGVLAYELIVGRPPFDKGQKKATINEILSAQPVLPAWLGEGAQHFIRWALTKDGRARPSVAQLSQHPWIQQHARASVPRRLGAASLPRSDSENAYRTASPAVAAIVAAEQNQQAPMLAGMNKTASLTAVDDLRFRDVIQECHGSAASEHPFMPTTSGSSHAAQQPAAPSPRSAAALAPLQSPTAAALRPTAAPPIQAQRPQSPAGMAGASLKPLAGFKSNSMPTHHAADMLELDGSATAYLCREGHGSASLGRSNSEMVASKRDASAEGGSVQALLAGRAAAELKPMQRYPAQLPPMPLLPGAAQLDPCAVGAAFGPQRSRLSKGSGGGSGASNPGSTNSNGPSDFKIKSFRPPSLQMSDASGEQTPMALSPTEGSSRVGSTTMQGQAQLLVGHGRLAPSGAASAPCTPHGGLGLTMAEGGATMLEGWRPQVAQGLAAGRGPSGNGGRLGRQLSLSDARLEGSAAAQAQGGAPQARSSSGLGFKRSLTPSFSQPDSKVSAQLAGLGLQDAAQRQRNLGMGSAAGDGVGDRGAALRSKGFFSSFKKVFG